MLKVSPVPASAAPPDRAHELVNAYLDRLDDDGSGKHSALRREERFKYRLPQVSVKLKEASGGWRVFKGPTRNISVNGIGIVLGSFVYPGTPCSVELVSLHSHATVQTGQVKRCRYLPGTPRLHEVGIKFDTPIKVEMFHQQTTPARLLVADDEQPVHTLIQALLQDANVVCTSVFDADAALKELSEPKWDVALIDLELPGKSGLEIARALRSAGVATPLVAILRQDDSSIRNDCTDAGFDLWIAKPFQQADLLSLMRSLRCEPVVSTFIQKPQMLVAIDSFARTAAQSAGGLLRMFNASDWARLASSVQSLQAAAWSTGFPLIAAATQDLLQALEDGLAEADRAALRVRIGFVARLLGSVVGGSCQAEAIPEEPGIAL